MNLLRSFAFKNAILYLIVFFLAFGIFGYLMFNNSSKRIIETVSKELKHRGDLAEIQTLEYFNELVSSLNYLTFNPILDNYLENKSSQNYRLLNENYLSLLKAHPDFAQVRYINAITGMEVVRVERSAAEVSITKNTQLQNKKDRPYFIAASELNEEDIYISPIDLNREYGEISQPRMPTLRLVRVVFKKDKREGVVVININLSNLFAGLKQTIGEDFSLQILNDEGFYLVHDNVDSTFLFEFDDVKPTNNVLNSHSNASNNQLRHSRKIQNELMSYDLILNVLTDKDALLLPFYNWRKNTILIMLMTVGLLTLFSFFIMNSQLNKWAKITAALRNFPKNRKPTNELVHRKDEIGEMAKSFEEMATVINHQMDAINTEKLRAEQAVKEKSEFIENISHEIRNPLQSIMGLSTMLENNNPNANQLDILDSLKFNTSNLQGLVNNVLDYQNVIKGNIDVQYDWSSITQIINEVVMGNKFTASEKKIQLVTDMDNQLKPYQHKIDRLRLSQILGNLLSNAIKFTHIGGKVMVQCKLENEDARHQISFSVVDDGIGMSESEVLKIKERYVSNRGVQALNSSYGIGLSIVTELIQLFDSELQISSKKGVGSNFSFTLNLERRKSLNPEIEDVSLFDLKGLEILIIEDDKQIINFYLHILSDSGAAITCIEEVDKLDTLDNKFDFIIADYRFARKSLLDVQHILEKNKKPDTSLLIASATSPDLVVFKKLFKHVKFIKKPFSNGAFKQSVNTCVIVGKFGLPSINEIKADYDYEVEKYMRALNILQDEWKSISQRIILAIQSDDSSAMESALHKFVTTLKRIDLHKLALWLDQIKGQMPVDEKRKSETLNDVNSVLETIYMIISDQIKEEHP